MEEVRAQEILGTRKPLSAGGGGWVFQSHLPTVVGAQIWESLRPDPPFHRRGKPVTVTQSLAHGAG